MTIALFLSALIMGIKGFYPWLKRLGFNPMCIFIGNQHRVLVDAKAMMYRFAYSIPTDSPNFHQSVCDILKARFGHFSHVTFVNDGIIDQNHAKYATVCKRKEQLHKQKENVAVKRQKIQEYRTDKAFHDEYSNSCVLYPEELKPLQQKHVVDGEAIESCTQDTSLSENNTIGVPPSCKSTISQILLQINALKNPHSLNESTKYADSKINNIDVHSEETLSSMEASLEMQARGARGVSFLDSVRIMEMLVQDNPNFSYIQRASGEADATLVKLSSNYDFVISEDSDLVIGGVKNLVVKFGLPEQALYNSDDVCHHLNVSSLQLKEIACLAGCDNMPGIKNMGLVGAHTLIQKYGCCENMIKAWRDSPRQTQKERKNYVIPDDIVTEVLKHRMSF